MKYFLGIMRVIAALIIIYKVYFEAGHWTCIAISLIFISSEIEAIYDRSLLKLIQEHIELSKMITKLKG